MSDPEPPELNCKHGWLGDDECPYCALTDARAENLRAIGEMESKLEADESREEVRALTAELADVRKVLAERSSKLEGLQNPVADLGYDNLDALVAVHQRNVKWLEQIDEALRLYRIPNKAEPQAFLDLTRAIEEPPE